MFKSLKFSVLAVASLALTGCIHHSSTRVKDPERVRVEFENESAAAVFYEALSKNTNAYSRSESTTKFSLPIVLDHEEHVITGPNAAFNAAVRVCDSNKDDRITETEARIYAAHPRS